MTNSSTNERTTDYINDFRGRVVVVEGPVAPYLVTLYDNRRAVAVGSYNTNLLLDATTDPTATATTGTGNRRLSLSESFFDARGQNWRQLQWEIDQSSGAKASSGTLFLESRTVFGPAGEVLQARGADAHRYNYDRLRRRTHDWTLASTSAWDGTNNHESYDDILDAASNASLLSVTGDIVLQENRTVYDKDKNYVLVTGMISRHHDDVSTTVGALDGTTGTAPLFDVSAINGRLHGITAMYHDVLDRPFETVSFGDARGTTGLLDFVYNSSSATSNNTSPPSASSAATSTVPAALVSKRIYDKYGRTAKVHDPKALQTQYLYDDAGRMITTRANAAGSGSDQVDTHFVYTAGLRTSMWVDADGSTTLNSGDQVTTYSYANNSSPASGDPGSLITVENLLTSVTYPDTGVVKYGYNAQGQQREMKDQSGNFTATTYDLGGRETLRALTVVGGFDATVRSVATVYGDPRGLVTQIAQYDGSSTLLDSVDFTYDNAGNLSGRTQTVDGTSWDTLFSHGLHQPNGLSAIAKKVTGTHVNGFRFFGLQGKS